MTSSVLRTLLLNCVGLTLAGQVCAEQVVLQLKWENEFQFAGYYAALWNGYYQDAGLEVEIRPAFDQEGRFREPQVELVSGRADFAIGGADILIGRDRGEPLVVLAPVFQKSPGAIVTLGNGTLKDREIRSLRDLSGLRIAANPSDYITHEFRALVGSRLTRFEPPVFIDAPLTLNTLLEGRADALLTYGISARHAAREAGVDVNLWRAADTEQLYYGDSLYTHQRVIDRNPEMVQRFRAASLKGWRYAMEHREAMARQIAQLPRYAVRYEDPLAYNLAFAEVIDEYLFYPHVALGLNDEARWRSMHRLMHDAGIVQGEFDPNALLMPTQGSVVDKGLPLTRLLIVVLSLTAICLIVFKTLPVSISLPALLAATLLVLTWSLEQNFLTQREANLRAEVSRELAAIRARLEGIVNRNFALLRGAAGFIAANPNMNQREFREFASALIDMEPLMIDIGAAPDNVVKFIYPLAGNEAALGLDYRQVEEQLPMVELARASRRMIIAGPLDLVQGGRAIIGRAPVFVPDPDTGMERYWGVVSAPMDLGGLFDEVGLSAPYLSLDIALRHGELSASAQDDQVFFGHPAVFAENPVVMPVSLGLVDWQIAAVPRGGWQQLPVGIHWIKLVGVVAVIGLALLLHVWMRQFQSRLTMSTQLRVSESILKRVGEIAGVGGWEWNLRSDEEHASDELYYLHGLMPSGTNSRPRSWLDYYDDDNRAMVENHMRLARVTGESQQFELVVNAGCNDESWLRHTIEPVMENREVVRLVGAVQDITAIRRADATIQIQASYDPVTSLPNRNLFTDRLTQALYKAKRDGSHVGVLFIDLDHFKDVNDSLGHSAGDKLLAEMGKRFRERVRKSDTVARLGGDEFTILIDGVHDPQVCTRMAEQLLEVAQQPVEIGDHQVFTTASIGATFYPDDAEDAQSLLRCADQAMYAAKNSGRNTVRFFTRSMQDEANRRHQLHVLLAQALSEKQLDVYYQPIINTRSGEIVKCEALLRWEHPTLGQVPPTEFVALAEDTGMIAELGEYVMLKACADVEAMNRELGTDIALAFNKSTREFVEESRAHASVLEALRQQAQFPNITIEITENLLLQENADTVSQIRALREAGVEIAIDDFGTGYSSLSYLRRFPVDIVKIDKSFIQEIEYDFESRALVRAIISMAHSLHINVVAEGVETPGQYDILRRMDCKFVQGYHFSRALPMDEFKTFVVKHLGQCA